MFSWKKFSLRRLYGLDKKTNVMDVKDGYSLDASNVFQDGLGRISKRRGTKPMFTFDSADEVDEIGSGVLSGTKYYFKFSGGDFHYSTGLTSAYTTISPTPAIGTEVSWAIVEDKLYFVDGTNALRFFDGTAIVVSSIVARPTAAPSAPSTGAFTYLYTLDNGQGQSPASPVDPGEPSAADVTVPNSQLQTGYKIRIYSRPDSVAATSLNVTGTSGGSNVTYGSDELGNFATVVDGSTNAVVATVAIADGQVQLYTELGEALNLTAPVGMDGIMSHYGRLVGWIRNVGVYFSKQFNSNSWPQTENIFFLPNNYASSDPITTCVSFLESLYIMQERNITVYGGAGPTDTGQNTFTERRLEANGNGCIAAKSAVVIEDNLVYLSRNGFYATNGTDPNRIGEKIETEIQALSVSSLESAVAFYHKRDGIYVCAVGTSSLRTIYTLDVRKDYDAFVGWFSWSGLGLKSCFYDEDRYLLGMYNGLSVYEDIATGSTQFTDALVERITNADVDDTTDTLTVTVDYETGTEIDFRTSGTPPSPLVADTSYYAIRISATEIQLAASIADALAGTEIDLTTTGTGTFSLIRQEAFECYYTTNWFNFNNPSYVKKLAKLGLLFDVSSSNISIDVSAAYNWNNTFIFQKSIIISSNHLWGVGTWGDFIWGSGAIGSPRNVAISRRKCRSVRYKFSNSSGNSNFNLLGLEQNFDTMRNRGNF